MTPLGVKETLVLRDASVATNFRFLLKTPQDVDAVKQPDGSWHLMMAPHDGPALILQAPFAVDGNKVIDPEKDNASLKVDETAAGLVIDLSIDEKWLRDPAREFPVLLDPTITIQPTSEDASFAANCSTCTPFLDDRIFIGASDNNVWRGALQFDLGGVPQDAVVTDGQLELYYDGWCMTATTSCRSITQQLDAHRMTKAWSTSSTTGQLGFDPTALASFSLDGTKYPQWMTWNVTTTVKNWVSGADPNYGFLMKRGDTEALGSGGPVPPGRRYTELSLMPKLSVTYTSDAVELLEPNTLHSNGADLNWTKYTGPSGTAFEKYEVHRSKTAGFAPSTDTLLATIRDVNVTTYRDTTAAPSKSFTYKIVANSSASNEKTVNLPADGQATKLLQPDPAAGKGTKVSYWTTTTNCANYGATETLIVGTYSDAVWRSLLEFDLRDIPTGSKIDSAKLSLWHPYQISSNLTIDAHRATRSWKEGTGRATCTHDGATWYDADGGVEWTNQGGDFDPNVVASVSALSGEASVWHDFDIASVVQQWVDGNAPNLGLLLKLSDETLASGRDITYYSEDLSASPTLRPKLSINYADGSHAQGPTVEISSPAEGAKVSGNVNITAAASDDRRVDKVEFFKGTTSLGTDTAAPFEATWATAQTDNGAHALSAVATDDAGNVTTSKTVNVTVENSNPPATTVTSPTGGSTVSGTVTVAADATDDFGVDRVEFFFDGNRIGDPDTSSPYSVSWNTLDSLQPAYDGTHQLTSRAYDTHGQMTESAAVSVTVDNTSGTKYRAGWSSTAVPPAMTYDPAVTDQADHGVDVTITNNSQTTWYNSDIVLRYRWMNPNGTAVSKSADIALGSNIRKTKSVTKRVMVEPPALPDGVDKAQYVLRFDLFDKPSSSYFAAKGNKPLDNPVIVNKQLKATALGLERYYHYEGEAVGAGMTHLTNVANGNSLLNWTPFSSPGRGLSTVLNLTYNSLEDRSESPVGNNFSLAISSLTRFGLPLDVHPNKADEIAGRSNKYIEFTDGDGTTHRFTQNANGGWDEPAGVHLYLREYPSTDTTRKWALTRPDRVTFFYNDLGFPTFVQDKNGNEISFTYEDVPPGEDPGGVKKRITTITDAAGQGSSPAPNRKFIIDYYSKAEAKKPQVRGKIQSIADHTGSKLFFDYYEDGNLLRITQTGGVSSEGIATADRSFVFTYTTSDGSGAAILLEADRINPDPRTPNQSTRLFSVRDPRGEETTFTYYGPTSGVDRWKLKSRTNRDSRDTSFAYDNTNTLTMVTAPLSRVTKYDYNSGGQVVETTDPVNRKTQVAWSNDLHVTKVTEPTGVFTEYGYNDNGYLTDTWDQLRNHTKLEYENVAVDVNDVSTKWKAGRSIPHISQLKTKTSPKGTATASPTDDFQWSFDYDAKGNVVKVTEPEGSPRYNTQYTYNADGTLATITDARGTVTADAGDFMTTFNSYDANGLPTKITDAKGRVTQMGYDDDGLLRWTQDPRHASNSGGDARAYRSYFYYDAFHRLARQSTPKMTTENLPLVWSGAEYDPNDNVVTQYAPETGYEFTAGPKTTMGYDPMDRVTSSKNPEGHETIVAYDAAGRTTQVTSPNGTATSAVAEDHAVFYDYDDLDRVIREKRYDTSVSPAKPLITHSCYDPAGDLVRVTAPQADVATVDCSATTPPQYTTRFTYDAAHRAKVATDPLGRKKEVSYDANGNVETMTDASTNVAKRFYDQRDLLVKVVEPFNDTRDVTSRYEYDGVGNMIKQISPRAHDAASDGLATKYTYDAVNQLTKIELPSSGPDDVFYVHRDYDANGNVIKTTLPDAAATVDGVPQDKVTTVTHFDTGWIKTSDDHVNSPVTFDYNGRGQQTHRTPQDGPTELWTYFLDGMLNEHRDREGEPNLFEYDPNNNLTVARDRTGLHDPTVKAREIRVTYDSLGRTTKVRQRDEDLKDLTDWKTTTFKYDLNSNVIERGDDGVEAVDGTVKTAPKRHRFTYDDSDWLRTQEDFLKSGGCQKITNEFTDTGWEETRVIRRSDVGCDSATSFDVKQSTRWDYFKNGKLKVLTTKNGPLDTGTVVEQHTVDYTDPNGVYMNGHRMSDTFFRNSPKTDAPCQTQGSACIARYRYDARDRLVFEDKGYPESSTDYVVDPIGNVTKETTGSETRIYDYDGAQLTKMTVNGLPVSEYIYKDGNLDCIVDPSFDGTECGAALEAGKVQHDYSYDGINRLTAYAKYSGGTKTDETTYINDALDRVTSETERHNINGTETNRTTDFTYQGLTNLVTLEEFSGDAKSNSKTYSYDVYGNRISMRDDPMDQTKEDKDYTYGYDVHGSISVLLDKSGTATASYGYDAYGDKDKALTKETEATTGTERDDQDPLNAYRYTGKRFDSGSGTLDMGARRFGPDVGRFLQQDQFSGALSDMALSFDPLTQNRYALAGGNPLSFIEWDGHMVMMDGNGNGSKNPAPVGTGGGGDGSRNIQQTQADTSSDNTASSGGGIGDAIGGLWDAAWDLTIGSAPERMMFMANPIGTVGSQMKAAYDAEGGGLWGVAAAANQANPVYHGLWSWENMRQASARGDTRAAWKHGAMMTVHGAETLALAVGGASAVGARASAPTSAAAPAFSRSQYGRVPGSVRSNVLDDSPVCAYCGKNPATQVDHVDSLKNDWVAGGWLDDYATRTQRVNSADNLVGACATCNPSKGALPLGEGPGQWWPPGWPSGVWWPFSQT